MLLDFPSPVLTVAPDALRHLDGDRTLESLWYLFTKCKGSLHDGPRLENISWRLWYRELAATNSYRPLTPNSPLSEVTDEPFVLSQGARIVSRQPIGQVIYEMLPGSSPNTTHTLNSKFRIPVEKKEAVKNVPPVTLLPTPAAELVSISIIPHDAYSSQGVPPQSPHSAVAAPSSIPSISTSNFVSTSSTSVPTINSTQSDNGIHPRGGLSFFPRVVVVNPTPNPTPHPTPPATPIPMSVSLHLPVTVSVAMTDSASLSSSQKGTGKLLLPPVQLLQPTSTPNSNMANDNSTPNPHSQTNARKFALSPEAPSASEDKRSVPHPQPNPGTGTLSASHSVATSRTVGLAKSGTSTSQLRSMEPMHIPESLLPLSPDPSSSSVASFHNWTMNVNSTDQNSNRAHTTETASSTAVPSSQASSGDNRISVGGNANKVNASGVTSGSVRGLPTSSEKSSTSPGRDASASSLAPKFFLSSTNASPSPGSGTNGSGDQSQSSFNSYSGSSFGRRSDASHSELMSVSPLDADVSQEPLNQRRQTSHSDTEVALPTATSSTLSHPYPTAGPSSPSSSSHSRTVKRTTNSHHYPYHTTHNYGHHPQKDYARRGKSKSVSGSRSRSRSRTRLAEGLTMTSAAPGASTSPRAKNTTSTSANDVGGAKPRPRRKGSGDAGLALGAKGTGDRGRYARPYGYGIFQVLNQNQNQSNTGPSTQTQKPSQGAQQQAKRLFRVGNGEEDDEGWEDDDDSSSLSRSLSQSQSRSRSRSSRSRRMSSRSPPAMTSLNGAQQGRGDATQHVQSEASTNGVNQQQLQGIVQQPISRILDNNAQLTASPSSQPQTETQLEARQTSAATISPNTTVSPGTQRLAKAPTDQTAGQQSTKKEGVVGAVVGPNGRKIVVIATDEDEDDSDDDDDDWEETEEDDDDIDRKPNNEVTDTSRKSSARTETITAAPKVTEAPSKGSDAAPADNEPTEDDEGWTSASSADDEPSKDPEAASTIQATVTAAQGPLPRGSGTKRLSNGTVTDNRHTNENLHGKDKGKQKAQFQQPLPKGPPRHYPNPPAPQVLQRAHSSKLVGPAGIGFTQQHQPNQPSRNPATRAKDHPQPPQQHPNPNLAHGRAPSARQPRRSVDMSEAALEAQRQLDLFAKKPKRAWSGLTRSGSGFLSQLMNPDPEIFPANHPYRRGYSSGDVAMPKGGVTRLGIAPLTPVGGDDGHHQLPGPIEVKKGGISAAAPPGRNVAAPPRKGDPHIGTMRPQAPGLKPSKSAVALPVAERVTAASVKDSGLVEGRIRNDQPQRNRAGSGGYRPKARPQDQEMEDTDTEEENRMDMSKSAAQGKLEAILKQRNAAKQKQQPAQPFRQQQDSGRISPRPDMPGRASTDIPPTALGLLPPPQMQRSRSQHVPGATATPTAPMPLGYPYNLPPAAPPSSPRTTRQLMLRKEMSESLRANLLWSRQLTRAETIGPRRRSSANVSGQWDNQNVNGHDLHNPPAMEPLGENGVAPSNVSQFPTLVQLNPKRRPGRGQMVDVGESSIQDVGWAGDRPPNARRKSSAAVTGAGRGDTGDGEGIHVGGGANVVTRTRSWGGLAGGNGGMTRMF